MGRRAKAARRKQGPLAAAIALAGALCISLPAGASAKKPPVLPTTPTCTLFSASKITALLGTGRLYLDHSFKAGQDSNCTYYGVTAAQAAKLTTDDVPYNQITYYPSLMISIETTTPPLLDVELGLFGKAYGAHRVAKALKPFSEEWFSAGTETGTNLMPCQSSGILYNNWAGPPDCREQPALKQVGVLGWIKLTAKRGRLVLLQAGQESPPGSLSISHMVALAEASVEGRLY